MDDKPPPDPLFGDAPLVTMIVAGPLVINDRTFAPGDHLAVPSDLSEAFIAMGIALPF
jgi:hypothetical protein